MLMRPSIASTRARHARIPGVHAVFTLDDLMPHLSSERTPLGQSVREIVGLASRSLRENITPFVLVRDEVCYVGDPIAVVVAESRCDRRGRRAMRQDRVRAAAGGSGHARRDCSPARRRCTGGWRATSWRNTRFRYGDCERAFAAADHRLALSLFQHRGCAHPMEGRGVLASHDPREGRTTVWTSTQSPHEIRMSLVQLLGLDDEELRIITPDVGGGFGAKYLIYPEEVVVPLAARLLGRPVKWVEDRREHFLTSIQERDQHWELEIALDSQGTILGVRGTLLNDQGAYTPQGINVSYNSATALPGPYKVPSYSLTVIAVETNKVPTMPVRGAGYPQGTFAIERLLDLAADRIGLDRAEIRRRNLIPAAAMPYTTPMKTRAGTPVKYDSGDFPKCQAMVLAAIDYHGFAARKLAALAEGRHIGIGIANGTKGTGRGPFETGIVRIGRSGRITVSTGAAAMGQGTATMLAQIAADQFNVAPAEVRVIAGDTAHVPMGHGGFASRQAVNAGNSVHIAAKGVRETTLRVAAGLLGTPVETSRTRRRIRARQGPQRVDQARRHRARGGRHPWLRPAHGAGAGTARSGADRPLHADGPHLQQCRARGGGRGRSGHRRGADPALCGGERLRPADQPDDRRRTDHRRRRAWHRQCAVRADDLRRDCAAGQHQFRRVLLPTATELPRIELISHISPSPLNPLGVKGVGECGVIPAAAAIMSAIEHALDAFGIRIAETPISPARIVEMVNSASSAAPAPLAGMRSTS